MFDLTQISDEGQAPAKSQKSRLTDPDVTGNLTPEQSFSSTVPLDYSTLIRDS